MQSNLKPTLGGALGTAAPEAGPPTVHAQTVASHGAADCDFDLNIKDEVTVNEGGLFLGRNQLPPLPQKLSPSQAARLAEILDFLHHHLTQATDNIRANEDGTQVTLTYADWQGVLAIQKLLAQYLRAVAEPEALSE